MWLLIYFLWFLASIEDNFHEEFSIWYPILILLSMFYYCPVYGFILLITLLLCTQINLKFIGNGDFFFLTLLFLLHGLPDNIFFILLMLITILNHHNNRSPLLLPLLLSHLITNIIRM